MIPLLLILALKAQYPLPEPKPECSFDPAVTMVFRWAVECPTHTLRFEFKPNGTFRVVCIPARKLRTK